MVVAPVFVQFSMKLSGSTADGNVHYTTRAGAELSTVVAGCDSEFTNRIGVKVNEIVPAPAIVFVVGSIQIPCSGVRATTVNRLPAVVYTEASKQPEAICVGCRNSRQQRQQFWKIPAI